MKVCVIIPYFQRETGILRHTLQSVLSQTLLPNVEVKVLIVDDDSPVTAEAETTGLEVSPPFQLNIIRQANTGVSGARNAGLQALGADIDYVAFLDSDDIWHEHHLALALGALEQGRDLYFCDNIRPDHHESQFMCGKKLLSPYITQNQAIIDIPKADIFSIGLRDLPGQTSTLVYRRACAPDLRFSQSLKMAGEDMLFFLSLCQRSNAICFSPRLMVTCGNGLNIYFNNLAWDSPEHFRQIIDRLKSHLCIRDQFVLDAADTSFNNSFIAAAKRKIAYLAVRGFLKNRRIRPEILQLLHDDRGAIVWFSLYAVEVIIRRMLGNYNPQ